MSRIIIYAAVALMLIGAGAAVVVRYNGAINRATRAEASLRDTQEQLSAVILARTRERDMARHDAAAAAQLVKDNEQARLEIEDLRSRVAAGTVRVRERFTCAPASVPGTTDSASGDNAAAERGLRRADADFLIRLASDADVVARRLIACQSLLDRR